MTSNQGKKGWLNPARLKIIVAIILIMVFAAVLDFTFPVAGRGNASSEFGMQDHLQSLAANVYDYHSQQGKLPEVLIGGDKGGFELSGKSGQNISVDPVINAGVCDEWPEIKPASIEDLRTIGLYKRKDKKSLYLFGQKGNRVCNYMHLDKDILLDLVAVNQKTTFLAGCFEYEQGTSDDEFTIYAVRDFQKTEDGDLLFNCSAIKCWCEDKDWFSEIYTCERKI